MRKNPRYLLWFIIGITCLAVYLNLPKFGNFKIDQINRTVTFDAATILKNLTGRDLVFRQGLDLEGGTSLVLKADMTNIGSSQRESALDSAKLVIEKRVNLFGVSEPIVQTSISTRDYRIIVELPGLTDIGQVRELIGATAQLTFWEQEATSSATTASPSATQLGFIKTELSGADLDSTSVSFDPNTGKPQVQLKFTKEGAKKFAEITKRNIGKPLAIVLDNQLIENPTVNQAILTGDAVITGGFTIETANNLSTQLNAGALPVPLEILSSNIVEPTLGIASLQKSLFAGILGFVIIVIFMTVLYKKLGLVASFALLLYALFNLTIFKLSSLTPFSITLTLSGIAGFILSIGMAVDANILIFERMKEELRLGKSRETSIELGFSRAWTSIRDSNVSTLITCFVLYEFGTGIVRGFALVLAIGVLVSMFSAIVITRTFLRLVYK